MILQNPPTAANAVPTLNTYLQGQQGVAVAVCAKHVLLYPGLRPQWSARAWELGRSDDIAWEGLLQGWDVTDWARYTHAAPSAVVPAPGHPPGAPAIALVTTPGRWFHHGLCKHKDNMELKRTESFIMSVIHKYFLYLQHPFHPILPFFPFTATAWSAPVTGGWIRRFRALRLILSIPCAATPPL